jgi:superfamily I DNA and/or RNA helicase
MAGKLKNLGLFENHFDVVIIDECAQATEVEAVASFIRLLNRETGKLVLAGDPQ